MVIAVLRLGACEAGGGFIDGRFGFFQQATLQFAFGLVEISLGQRALGLFTFQFGELVAENGEVGGLAVGPGFRHTQAEPQGGQNEGGNHHNEQGGEECELGHLLSSSLSSASARLASSAERGLSSAATRSARRRW